MQAQIYLPKSIAVRWPESAGQSTTKSLGGALQRRRRLIGSRPRTDVSRAARAQAFPGNLANQMQRLPKAEGAFIGLRRLAQLLCLARRFVHGPEAGEYHGARETPANPAHPVSHLRVPDFGIEIRQADLVGLCCIEPQQARGRQCRSRLHAWRDPILSLQKMREQSSRRFVERRTAANTHDGQRACLFAVLNLFFVFGSLARVAV